MRCLITAAWVRNVAFPQPHLRTLRAMNEQARYSLKVLVRPD